MKYLVSTVETWRVDTESEATQLIADAKAAKEFTLSKYNCERKDIKEKSEIVGEYYKVSLTKVFNEIKDPVVEASVIYEVY